MLVRGASNGKMSPTELWIERLESLLDGAEVALEQHLAAPGRSDWCETSLKGAIRFLKLDLAEARDRQRMTASIALAA